MTRRIAVGLIVAVGLVALSAGWGFYRNSTISRQFESVTVGASDAQVRHLRTAIVD